MSTLFEHDYIGLAEVHSIEASARVLSPLAASCGDNDECSCLEYTETELRLGLPGSGVSHRKVDDGAHSVGLLNGFASGVKRGLRDVIQVPREWNFCSGDVSEAEHCKGGVLFSIRGGNSDGDSTGQGRNVPRTRLTSDAVVSKNSQEKKLTVSISDGHGAPTSEKAQVIGWPPIRSFRKNTMCANPTRNCDSADGQVAFGCLYVKVSMDGAPYLRKVDLKTYGSYKELCSALEKMFSCFIIGQYGPHKLQSRDGVSESKLIDILHGSEYVLTYEDKDGDWMRVGDVPWEMFTASCKRLRIMKGADAIGLAPRAVEKCKNLTLPASSSTRLV